MLSCAIVGLPNVGKSTLFNALLKKQLALAANYPFATIEPNVGVAEVPDERLAVLAQIVAKAEISPAANLSNATASSPSSQAKDNNFPPIKPAVVEFVDVAGLVRGASKGEGLGNQFLAHIRETNSICHVLRAFSDESILREGSISPKEDLATIRTELQLADLATLDKQKEPKGAAGKEEKMRWQIIQKFKEKLEKGINIISEQSSQNLSEEEANLAKELCLLTAKKEIFVINVDEEELKNQAAIIKQYVEELDVRAAQIVVVSAKIESELAVLAEEDQLLYLQDLGLKESGLERLAKVAYQTLALQSFLTAGEKEVRAWTIKKGSTAVQAAAVIHNDFEKNFIKAKVVSFDDFVSLGGWPGAKAKGKLRLEGRDYVMQEGDVVEFMVGK
ncbi:MAG: redox-regulated ATPase YchF [Candidatus Woesebacteria bacterium]|jgi:GTP-binding protein YchF